MITSVKEMLELPNFYPMFQVRNQEFFTTGKFFWNQGTSINIHLQHQKERPHEEKNLKELAIMY